MRFVPNGTMGWTVAILIILSVLTILSFVGMILWNWLMPMIFGLPTIGMLEFFGLCILTSFLFWRG